MDEEAGPQPDSAAISAPVEPVEESKSQPEPESGLRTLVQFDSGALRRTLFVIFAAVIAFEIVTHWGLTVTTRLSSGMAVTGRLSSSRPNIAGQPRSE